MTPDDPRHGTHRGYIVGCRDDCCTRAHTIYMKLYRMGRRNRIVDPTGTRRRIQALQRLGWHHEEISRQAGMTPSWSQNLLRGSKVTSRTALQIARAYDQLSMTLPPDTAYSRRTGARAERLGWAPPLAWDSIDTDPAPLGQRSRSYCDYDSAHILDEATVIRVLAGENLPTNRAEKTEVMRRWLASGQSERSLCERLGWKAGRYMTRDQEAS